MRRPPCRLPTPRRPALPTLLVASLMLLPAMALTPASAETQAAGDDDLSATLAAAVADGLAYLAASQREDGTFPVYATNLVEAVSAAGRDPQAWPSPERSAYDALGPYGNDAAGVYASYLRNAHAAGTSGYDPRALHGEDYVALIRAGFVAGQFGDVNRLNDDAWAILGLRAAGVAASDAQVQAAADHLVRGRAGDGGWSYMAFAARGDTDMTGMVLAALRAAGRDVSGDAAAVAFLHSTFVSASGGHSSSPGGGANCQSTAWALHGYHALDLPARAASIAFLLDLQREDGGFAIAPSLRGSNAFCTTEVLPVLAGALMPRDSFAPARVVTPTTVYALEPATLSIEGPFERATWTFGDQAPVDGISTVRSFAQAGTYAFRFAASGEDAIHRGGGTLQVRSARPTVEPVADVTDASEGVALEVRLNASDPDSASVSWEGFALPQGARLDTVDAFSVILSWVPSFDAAGDHVLQVRASDGEGAREASFRVVVADVNRAPAFVGPDALVGTRDRVLDVTLQARDPDGDALRFEGVDLPADARLDEATGRLTWKLDEASYPDALRFAVLDGRGGRDERAFPLEVRDNAPPELRVAVEGPHDARATSRFDARASADPEGGGPLRFWWEARDANGRAFAWSREAVFEPSWPRAGAHEVSLVAEDADGVRAEKVLPVAVDDALELVVSVANARVTPTQRPVVVLQVFDDAGTPAAGAKVRIQVRHAVTGDELAGYRGAVDADGRLMWFVPYDVGGTSGLNLLGRHDVLVDVEAPSRAGAPVDDLERAHAARSYVVALPGT